MDFISTHSLTRRLTSNWKSLCKTWSISTHSLTRRLTSKSYIIHRINHISTHSLTRRLTRSQRRAAESRRNFNSQPHKEADGLPPALKYSPLYFNSQPHKEADYNCFSIKSCACISTHSLTRRLTGNVDYGNLAKGISTHSLTRRLTSLLSLVLS